MKNIDTFRLATLSDIEAITQLVNAAYRTNSTSSAWTHEADLVSGDRINPEQLANILLKPEIAVLVAVRNSHIVACVEIEKQSNVSYISMLAVTPDLQAIGIGKQTLAYAEHYAQLNFHAETFAMIVLSSRPELIAFYLRRGYQKTGKIMNYPLSAGVGIPKQSGLKLEVLEKCSAVR